MCDPFTDISCLAALTTLGSVVASFIAAGITAWMAVETRRMATATNRSVSLQYRPLLGIRDVRVETEVSELNSGAETPPVPLGNIRCIRVGIELFNAGQVELTYRMRRMRVSFANRTSDDGTWLSRSGLILPASSSVFMHPPITLDPAIDVFPAKGRIDVEFEYYHDKLEVSKELQASIEYVLTPVPSGFIVGWTFIDEPPAV